MSSLSRKENNVLERALHFQRGSGEGGLFSIRFSTLLSKKYVRGCSHAAGAEVGAVSTSPTFLLYNRVLACCLAHAVSAVSLSLSVGSCTPGDWIRRESFLPLLCRMPPPLCLSLPFSLSLSPLGSALNRSKPTFVIYISPSRTADPIRDEAKRKSARAPNSGGCCFKKPNCTANHAQN